jgi:hypothetical protein
LSILARHVGHADPDITARPYTHLLSTAQLDQAAGIFQDPPGNPIAD